MHERKKGDQNTKESHKPEEEICMKEKRGIKIQKSHINQKKKYA